MRTTKDVKQNKGITLIALVITIIVMLILVAVTITMAVNGGLFDYASSAGSQTNEKRDAEQEYANLQSGMTYDDLINKYTGWTEGGVQGGTGNEGGTPEEPKEPSTPEGGDDDATSVALSEINIGDYITGYPVEYTNVVDIDEQQFTKWRVLSKVKDANGNITNIKIISAGVPLTYSTGGFLNSMGGVDPVFKVDDVQADLTTNFLDTQVNPDTIEECGFRKCGFNLPEGTNNLRNVFSNNFTYEVKSLTWNDIEMVWEQVYGEVDPYACCANNSEIGNLIYIPLINDSTVGVETALGDFWTYEYIWLCGLSSRGWVESYENGFNEIGVRPVVTLNSDVIFKEATTKINNTMTYEILLPE